MTQEFLNHTQVCSPFEQMRRSRVAQSVGSQTWQATHRFNSSVHYPSNRALIDSRSPRA